MAIQCLVCRESTSESYGDWQWKIWDETYRLARCLSCGSVFTDPLPTDVTLKKLYDTNFDYRWYRDHYAAKLRDCRMRLHEYREALGRRVLDFGGGIGYFSAAARELGFDSVTYDPLLSKKKDIGGKWDTLVALHVLEHSNDLDGTIEQIKGLLVPGGKLILAVPNLASLGYKKLGMNWVWAQPPLVHIYHFNALGIQSLLSRHGFKNFRISYHERWDANLYSDLEKVRTYRLMDSLWSIQPCNSIPLCRKVVANINSFRRFRGLDKALKNYIPDSDKYAELQVIASHPGEVS